MHIELFVVGALAFVVAAQSSTTTDPSNTTSSVSAATTMNLFIGPGGSGSGFVGSVINADSCGTTYGIVCTADGGIDNGIVEEFCNASSTLYGTYGPSSYGSSTSVSVQGGYETEIWNCSLAGTTGGVCSFTGSASENGKRTSVSTVITLLSEQVVFWQVPITAGASKLANPAPCTSTKSAAAAAATGISEVYKVLIIPGAAALLAGALA